jgi:hypothetical protein
MRKGILRDRILTMPAALRGDTTMAQNNSKIIERVSFKEFFMNNGKRIQRVPCTNAETHESFCMLAVGSKFVGFSKNLGELTNAEINSMKNELQVVQLAVDPDVAKRRREAGQQEETYRLCKQGESTWEDVEITGW